jgi:hypothetical protein
MVLCLALACQDSGGAGEEGTFVLDGAGTAGDPVTDEQRAAVFESLRAAISRVEGMDRDEQNEALARELADRPEIAWTGWGPSGAWARFTDDRLLMIDNQDLSGSHPPPPVEVPEEGFPEEEEELIQASLAGIGATPDEDLAQVSSAASGNRWGLPWSNRVCFFSTHDRPWLSIVQDMFKAEGEDGRLFAYQVEGEVGNMSVEAMMAPPADCGVVAVNCHGSGMTNVKGKLGTFDSGVYGLYTTTPWTPANDRRYQELLDSGALVYYHPMGWTEPVPHYAITAEFIDRYWVQDGVRFTRAPFFYLNSCSPFSSMAKPMRDKIMASGVDVLAGWTLRSFDADGSRAASYVFDRLLGTNHLEAPEPPQRPFGWHQLGEEMLRLNIGRSIDGNYPPYISELKFEAKDRYGFAQLAPSIEFLAIDDLKNELTVRGTFGGAPDDSKVEVGGQDCPVEHNRMYEIICKIPQFGPGSSGDVVVRYKGNQSNHVKLTSWKGKGTYRILGPGDLHHKWTYDLHFRGDVHDARELPGRKPVPRDKPVSVMKDSSGQAEFGGEYQDGNYWVKWNGSLMVPLLDPNTASGGGTIGFATMGWVHEDAPGVLWWMLFAFGESQNHEQEWKKEKGAWKQVNDGQRVTNMPMGPELVNGADGIPYFWGFTYKQPVEIDPHGVIRDLVLGPEEITGFGNLASTGWDYRQDLKIEGFTPESGTAIEDDDAR